MSAVEAGLRRNIAICSSRGGRRAEAGLGEPRPHVCSLLGEPRPLRVLAAWRTSAPSCARCLENLGPTCARCLENLGPFVCWLLGEPRPHVCSLPAGRVEGTLGCGLGFLSRGYFAFLVTRKLGSLRKHPVRQEVESSSALNSGSQSHFPLYSARQSQESDSRGRDVDLTSWQHWQRIWG